MSSLNDEDRENLAAYLDGELDEPAAQALEAKLTRDPEARREVNDLRRAWSMLDFLPRAEPSPNFTSRTLERLTIAMPRAAATAAMPPIRPRRWLTVLAWLGVILLALIGGAVVGRSLYHPEEETDDPLEKQQRVVEHFLLYAVIEDLDYLKSLDKPELFAEGNELPSDGKVAESSARQRRAVVVAFKALPRERRDQILQLDRELFAEPAAVSEQLINLAQRYRDWYDRLTEGERKTISDAPDKAARLTVVKDLCDQQWLSRQPKADRDRVDKKTGKERADLITKLRQADLHRLREWQIVMRFRYDGVLVYINEYLKPMLNKDDLDRLAKAEENWPSFLQTVVDLADKHPPALNHGRGPETINDLPDVVHGKLGKKKDKANFPKNILKQEGRWPDFPIAVADHFYKLPQKKAVVLPYELWPTYEECLSRDMKNFLKDKLLPVLTKEERALVDKDERGPGSKIGKWPDYPEAIDRLAKEHGLTPPWFTLPGPKSFWDTYRSANANKTP